MLADAPMERLQGALRDPSLWRQPASRRWRVALLAASVALMLIAALGGLWLGRMLSHPVTNWREAVAIYHMLYSRDTLAPFRPASREIRAIEKQLSAGAGLPIRIPDLSAQGLRFARGQLLRFSGKALVQLAYLSDDGKPVALCFLADQAAPRPPASERRHGMTVVHWVRDGTPTMLIGALPEKRLLALARIVLPQSP